MICTKAIIPVAGFGTRRLPITKAIEKCMLPVLNRPVIDYIVQDCIAAGITDFYFVVGEDCKQLRQYYSHNELLEKYLKLHHKEGLLPDVQAPAGCKFNFIVQPANEQYGTAVPVWLCRDIVAADEKVLVIMGDQFMYNADGASETARFLTQAELAETDSAMLGILLPDEELYKYGIIATDQKNNVDYFTHIVEKPHTNEAPSNLANASFYLFDKAFFGFLEKDVQGPKNGEYVITDPLNEYVEAGKSIAVIANRGEYLDCGTVEGWLEANQKLFIVDKTSKA